MLAVLELEFLRRCPASSWSSQTGGSPGAASSVRQARAEHSTAGKEKREAEISCSSGIVAALVSRIPALG